MRIKASSLRRDFSLFLTRFIVVFMLFGAGGSSLAQDMPDFGYCSDCTTTDFALAAKHAVPSMAGTYPVYVLDVATGEVRYFEVDVWWDCGDNELQSTSPEDEHDQVVGTLSIQGSCTYKQAIPLPGDQLVKSAIQDAFSIILEYQSFSSVAVDIGDIPGAEHIESAIALVGPDEAALNRIIVRNGLNEYFGGFWHSALTNINDLAHNALNKLFENSIFAPDKPVWIEFPDGTKVRVQVDAYDLTGFTVEFTFTIETESVQGPGLGGVPQEPGQFNNFHFKGSQDIGLQLLQLAERYGNIVCDWECEAGSNNCILRCQYVP